jgi:hypothetical protein
VGRAALAREDATAAAGAFGEAVNFAHRAGMRWHLAGALEGLAAVAVATGGADQAARLLGAAAALRQAIDAPLPPSAGDAYERTTIAARTGLGSSYNACWEEGRAMPLDDAVALALAFG